MDEQELRERERRAREMVQKIKREHPEFLEVAHWREMLNRNMADLPDREICTLALGGNKHALNIARERVSDERQRATKRLLERNARKGANIPSREGLFTSLMWGPPLSFYDLDDRALPAKRPFSARRLLVRQRLPRG